MCIWLMSLKDKRSKGKCADKELKFRLCKEKGILAIGWGIYADVTTWQEYFHFAKKIYVQDNGFLNVCKNFVEMSNGDLVWVKNPVTNQWFLVEITDTNAQPTICKNLQEFDICSYRLCKFLPTTIPESILSILNSNRITKRSTLFKIKNKELQTLTLELIN